MSNKDTAKNVEVSITREWQPPNALRVDDKDPSKAYRWVDKDKIEQKKYQGWNPVDEGKVKYAGPDGQQADGRVHYRELILCDMPKEMAESRNRYYQERANRAVSAQDRKFEEQARRLNMQTYNENTGRKKYY